MVPAAPLAGLYRQFAMGAFPVLCTASGTRRRWEGFSLVIEPQSDEIPAAAQEANVTNPLVMAACYGLKGAALVRNICTAINLFQLHPTGFVFPAVISHNFFLKIRHTSSSQ